MTPRRVSQAVKAGVTSSVDSVLRGGGGGAGQHVQTEIAAPFDSLVVLFGENRPDEPDQGGTIREDPDHIGPPPDLIIEALL
ncbi:hypothetical protein GFS60_07623 (plasmid) [Rhodococcus sp. WAY2]|nr:hypothetical protein GFS60_07623 [Rhodococcus sp. WAY2]